MGRRKPPMPAVLELRAVADRRDDGDLWSDALDLRNAPARFALDKPRSRSLKKVVEGSPRPRAIVVSSLAASARIFGMRRQVLVMLLARPGSSSRAAQQLTIGCRARALGHPAVRSCCEEPTRCAAARRADHLGVVSLVFLPPHGRHHMCGLTILTRCPSAPNLRAQQRAQCWLRW